MSLTLSLSVNTSEKRERLILVLILSVRLLCVLEMTELHIVLGSKWTRCTAKSHRAWRTCHAQLI